MGMISLDYQDTVAIVRLNRDIKNALDLKLVSELDEILKRTRQDPYVLGLVLGSSSDKFFSIGFDIQKMFDYPREDFELFYKAFNRVCLSLYTFPKPTVAAITGHAVAGGCILVLCCDYRFMGDQRRLMGLNEIKLGVPVPYLADCVLKDIVGARIAKEMTDTGEFYGPMESLQMGLVDKVLPTGEVEEHALRKVKGIESCPLKAFALIKQNRTEEVEKRFLISGEKKAKAFIDCWYSGEARKLLKDALKKF
jgi:enoyl-CoA hydratase/carnithine racemase